MADGSSQVFEESYIKDDHSDSGLWHPVYTTTIQHAYFTNGDVLSPQSAGYTDTSRLADL